MDSESTVETGGGTSTGSLTATELASRCKNHRGIAKALIMCIDTWLKDLEAHTTYDIATCLEAVRQANFDLTQLGLQETLLYHYRHH